MSFIRLLRPLNLCVLLLSMVGVRCYLSTYLYPYSSIERISEFHFFLLVFSTLLIAAAGNIINDYFDVRSDRINRPLQVIVDKRLKRRWAIIFHWFFSSIAFLIALYLSFIYRSFYFVGIHILSISILWSYSVSWKKKPVIGNLSIGFLAFLSLFITMRWMFLELSLGANFSFTEVYEHVFNIPILYLFVGIIEILFIQLLIRELLKDVTNVRGDTAIGARTLPILIGIPATKRMIAWITLLYPFIFFLFILGFLTFSPSFNWMRAISLIIIACMNICVGIALFQKKYIIQTQKIKLLVELTIVLLISYFFIG